MPELLPRNGPGRFSGTVGAQAAGLWRRARVKRAVLFYARAALRPRLAMRWWRFLSDLARDHRLGAPHDELLQKPVAKFLARGLGARHRLDLICNHFRLAAAQLSTPVLRHVWAGGTVAVGQLSGRAGVYRVDLLLADCSGGRHEGCFALFLRGDGTDLCSLKFVLAATPAGPTAIVGGVQGSMDAKRAVIQATRDLGGLRPKEVLLLVLQGWLQSRGAPGYLAVSRDRLPIVYRRRRRQTMLKSDTDSFWHDRRGTAEPVYGFSLPWSALDGTNLRARAKRDAVAIGAALAPLMPGDTGCRSEWLPPDKSARTA